MTLVAAHPLLGAIPLSTISWRSSAHALLLQTRKYSFQNDFTPPISNLKPVHGLDPKRTRISPACAGRIIQYELIFCATDQSDPCVQYRETDARFSGA